MASVFGYIGGKAGGGRPNTYWCRPAHKPTCCMWIACGGACCVCVPSTATCFVIEMWGQGGGGAGGCCCGNGPYGGQGGAYGWVTCTTSGVNHILCACNCYCICSQCSICQAYHGQFSRVVQCQGGGLSTWCVCGGATGVWCCFWGGSCCCCAGKYVSNVWRFYMDYSKELAQSSQGSVVATDDQQPVLCCDQLAQCGCVCVNAAIFGGNNTSEPVKKWIRHDAPFDRCCCTCFSSPYVWLGACGWSDPDPTATPMGSFNFISGSTGMCQIPNSQCGGGMGVGGAAYAGGDQSWYNNCGWCCFQCWAIGGYFPGGGGKTSGGGTAWTQPGQGGSGLILISWC